MSCPCRKNAKKRIFDKVTKIIALLSVFVLVGCPDNQVPLIKLSQADVGKLLATGVKNLVLINKDAESVQIVDIFADKPPQVRLTKVSGVEKSDVSNLQGPAYSPNAQLLQQNGFLKVVDNYKVTNVPPKPIAELTKNQVDNLLLAKIFYIELRDEKDRQIQVVELTEDRICIPCLLASQKKESYQSNLFIEKSKSSIMSFVISSAEAACNTSGCSPTSCNTGNCSNIRGNCCNCRR